MSVSVGLNWNVVKGFNRVFRQTLNKKAAKTGSGLLPKSFGVSVGCNVYSGTGLEYENYVFLERYRGGNYENENVDNDRTGSVSKSFGR